jgi:hypothetical protein
MARVLAGYMADPIEYSEEKDMRFELESTSASDRVGRCPDRAVSSARAAALSGSSRALPFFAAPRESVKPLSDALDRRRRGNCLGTDLEAGGGMETLDRSTLPTPVSGPEDRAFLLVVEPSPAVRRCGVRARVLSELTVRDSCSMLLNGAGGLRSRVGCVQKCFFRQAIVVPCSP